MINWIIENKKFLKIRAIEKELKMPDSTLIKHINGSQKMAEKWIEPLNKFIMVLQKPKSVGKKNNKITPTEPD